MAFFFSLVFKEAGNGCDGGINQLGGNVLESHRRYWHWSETGTVSNPEAMAFPVFSENTFFHTLTHFVLHQHIHLAHPTAAFLFRPSLSSTPASSLECTVKNSFLFMCSFSVITWHFCETAMGLCCDSLIQIIGKEAVLA